MKRSLLLLLVFLIAARGASESERYLNELRGYAGRPGDGAEASSFDTRAMKAHGAGQYPEAEKLWFEAARIDPSNPKYFFNLARSTTLQGKAALALEYLKLMKNVRFDEYYGAMLNDPDLAALRSSSAGAAFFQEIRKDLDTILWVKGLIGTTMKRHCAIGACDSGYEVDFTVVLHAKGALDVSGGYVTRKDAPGDGPPGLAEVKNSYALIFGRWRREKEKLVIDLDFTGNKTGSLVFRNRAAFMKYFSDVCAYDPDVEKLDTE